MMIKSVTAYALVLLSCLYLVNSRIIDEKIRTKRHLVDIENPNQVINTLESVIQAIANGVQLTDDIQNSKRGLDLGLSRGFSGSKAAKQLMGMSAASFANGPGKRK